MQRNDSLLPLILTVTVTFFLTGCGSKMPNADEAIDRGILLYGNGSEPESIDPHLSTGHPDATVVQALIEGLIGRHKTDDNLPDPGLAESWESANNAQQWTFHLRKNAKWSNGDPIVADDFIYSFRRILSQRLAAEFASMLYIMKNARAYHEGDITDFSEVGVQALDDHTLQFNLIGPSPHFLSMVAHHSWYPVHRDTIEAHGTIDSRISKWTRAGNYVGSGPFILEEWVVNQIIKVKKNPHYWDADAVKLEHIYFFPIADIHTEHRLFLNGQLHKTLELPSESIDSVKDKPYYRNDPVLSVYYYMINTTRPPMNDVRVRLALSYAIDRRSITEDVVRRGETPATSYTPPGFDNYNPSPILEYNPEKARKLLAEAGYPNGEGFPLKQILFNNHAGHQAIAEAIQQMWKETLNLDIELYNQEWKVYLETRNRMEYDIARAGWVGDYMDPGSFLDIWQTEENDSLNDTGWSNPRFDELLKRAQQSDTLEGRYRNYEEAENILLNELPCIPIYWYRRPYLIDQRLKGYHAKQLDMHNFKYLYFEN